MKDTRQISLCITTYNRVDMTIRSFQDVHDDPRIHEIVILDDGSSPQNLKELREKTASYWKVAIFHQHDNEGVYQAKKSAIMLAYHEWCILLDSDNIIGKDYLDSLFKIKTWDNQTAYLPAFAKETFDYRHFAGVTLTKENVASYMDHKMFDCLINTMNGFYNRTEYQLAFKDDIEPLTADSMYMNYLLLTNDVKLFVVPGLEYVHTIHDGSHYKQHSGKNTEFRDFLIEQYKNLPNGILH